MRQHEKKPLSWGQALLALVIVITPILFFVFSGDKQPNLSSSASTQESTGTYSDHKSKQYQYSISQTDRKQTATFQPALPRDDTTVTGAILDLINATYGNNTVTNLQPQLVERNGSTLVMFSGTEGNYYALLIKNDAGDVHSISYWRE